MAMVLVFAFFGSIVTITINSYDRLDNKLDTMEARLRVVEQTQTRQKLLEELRTPGPR